MKAIFHITGNYYYGITMVSQLENELACIKHDWAVDTAIIISNDIDNFTTSPELEKRAVCILLESVLV